MNRNFLSAALVLVLSGGVALAQQPAPASPDGPPPPPMRGQMRGHHPPDPQREVKHLTRALNLTPDQAAKLEPVFAGRDQQMHAILSNGQLTQADAHAQMKALHKSTEDQIAGILTPDQLAQFKQMRRGPHGPGGQGGFGGQRGQQGPPPPPPSGL